MLLISIHGFNPLTMLRTEFKQREKDFLISFEGQIQQDISNTIQVNTLAAEYQLVALIKKSESSWSIKTVIIRLKRGWNIPSIINIVKN